MKPEQNIGFNKKLSWAGLAFLNYSENIEAIKENIDEYLYI